MWAKVLVVTALVFIPDVGATPGMCSHRTLRINQLGGGLGSPFATQHLLHSESRELLIHTAHKHTRGEHELLGY